MTDTSDKALLALADRLDAPEHWLSGSDAGHEGENSAPVEAAAAFRAIVAERQAGVQVKPLVWGDPGESEFWANHPFGWCEVIDTDRGFYATQSGVEIGRFNTAELAKAAAQADYEARIRAALKGPNDDQ